MVRPDSGDPPAVVVKVLDLLGEAFGSRATRRTDRCGDTAPDLEEAGHADPAWARGQNEIVEDPVGHRLVKNALVPPAPQIQFERLELHQGLCGLVLDDDGGEVGLARPVAEAGELPAAEPDLVVPARFRIGKRLEPSGGSCRQTGPLRVV